MFGVWAYDEVFAVRTLTCPSKQELDELCRTMLERFPARDRKGEKARLARARAYWEAMG